MYRNIYCSAIQRTISIDTRNFLGLTIYPSFKFKFLCYCDNKVGDYNDKPLIKTVNEEESMQPALETKYTIFKDSDAPILLDVYEEKIQEETRISETAQEFHGLPIEHGIAGVFDVEDLVELLRRDKAEDIFVAQLPPEARYVDHIVIVTGRSRRHMIALTEIVRRMFKKRRYSTDIIPRIEGENSSTWMAMDLGNIALHVFSRDARSVYDLETLWSVGTEFDTLSNSEDDPLIALLKKHSISLNDVTFKGQLL